MFDMSVGLVGSRAEAVSFLDAFWLMVISVKESTVVFFGEGVLIVEGFVLDVVFFLQLGFLDAMGSSSDIKLVLDPRILIMRSMFFHVLLCI
jgi:hypothetical protein